MATQRKVTAKKLLKLYTKQDRERICLEVGRHPKCGTYVCQLAKGHERGTDVRLQKHQAACRKHHCCIISWNAAAL